jgi:uncharacterized protein YqjF (DUF2071 family)
LILPTPAISEMSPGRLAMRQDWWHLLFLHWDVPADDLQRLLPSELEVERYEGRAYVGLVPFTMTGVRPWWSPTVPGLSRFHEVNVRTYVTPRSGGPPGVWFFSLDAANPVAVAMARRLWGLPYHWARMRLNRSRSDEGESILFESRRRGRGGPPAGCRVRYEPYGEAAPAQPGTLDSFLVDRYVLYCLRRGRLCAGRVHHAPYRVRPVRVSELEETLVAAAGIHRPSTPPLAHYSEGVRVRVGRLLALND